MNKTLKDINNPFKFFLLLLRKLPIGLVTGMKLVKATEEQAIVQIKYQYITQNPFRSIYVGCLAMGAELASGVLGMVNVLNIQPAVSMLVVHMEADFVKKATGKVFFTCNDGLIIKQAADETRATGESRTVVATSVGVDEVGNQIATFRFTWSFKAKKATPQK